MRNLVHINKNRFVFFIYPRKNKTIDKQATFAKNHILTSNGQNNFKILYIEDIIDEILKQNISPKINNQYKEFKVKYII